MTAATIILLVCSLFAALLGFAAHRASICTVRAVAEMMSARTVFMLASIGKSALWSIALILSILIVTPTSAAGIYGSLTGVALVGGLLFGIGAAINGGCAYSTMTRLVDGEIRMALTVAGFAAGILVFTVLVEWQWLARPARAQALIGSTLSFAAFLLAGLSLWAIYELWRIWHKRPKETTIGHRALASQYRLSTAALLIGLSSAIIFLLFGSAGYTVTLQNFVESSVRMQPPPAASRWILLLAVLAGMLLSTLQRGSFRLDWRPRFAWLRNFSGGALMGLGTAMLPGGNDALVLYGIPSLSPHALPGYLALVIGVAIGLYAMRWFGINSKVVCRNDLYVAQEQPKGSILNGHPPRG